MNDISNGNTIKITQVKNPLRRRILRELKSDFGKYFVLFAFMVLLIGAVSSFIAVDDSVAHTYYEGFEKYNLEYGHVNFDKEPDNTLLQTLERKGAVKFYNLSYSQEIYDKAEANIRIYRDRKDVNLACIMEGEAPSDRNEIALDRMFAQNAEVRVGDSMELSGKQFRVSGLIAVPDYSCLFENNSDMMFDSVHFGVAVVTDEGYEYLDSSHETISYAWLYDNPPKDEKEEKKLSDDFLEIIKDEIKSYDEKIVQEQIDAIEQHAEELQEELEESIALMMQDDVDAAVRVEEITEELKSLQDVKIDESKVIAVTDYLPRYLSRAIQFTGEDMSSDRASFIVFDYLVTIVLAFLFAVTISNTISKEAGTIGTLRASGYSKRELIAHYMILPVVVTLMAAIAGNVLGYTVLKNLFVTIYYNSYSLAPFEMIWSRDAFISTTVVPFILMVVINLIILTYKLQLSPLKFLRHELSRRTKKRAAKLSDKIPFFSRLRIRTLFQNIPSYMVLIVGIFFAGVLCVFGIMFVELFQDYSKMVTESEIAPYQYLLKSEEITASEGAEKFSASSLSLQKEGYLKDEVMVYGIDTDSRFVDADMTHGRIYISNGIMDKYDLKPGDTLTLQNEYTDEKFDFEIEGEYKYDAALSVFMDREEFNLTFDKGADYFNGYFSDVEIDDIPQDKIATIITEDDLKKVADQLLVSMGDFMTIITAFGVIMFLLMMYLLTRQIIEKNTRSISMTKILGFSNAEIGKLYLISTSLVVIFALLITVPLVDVTLRWIFHSYLYTAMSGYIPYIVSNGSYVTMVLLGIASYIAVSLFMLIKIKRIPMDEALKNIE